MLDKLKEYKLEKDGRLLTDGELDALIEIIRDKKTKLVETRNNYEKN